jgi:hypothetical protein
MIEPRLPFRCGFAIALIPQLDGESGTRTRSAKVGDTLYFANIPEMAIKNHHLISVTCGMIQSQ